MSEDPLLAVADELYALPLAEFTAARDAEAKAHKADKGLAGRVKALRKPSVAAWVVNLLTRRESDQVAQLLAVGEALRAAQEGMDAGQLRELTKQRRAVTAAVAGRARGLAIAEGQRPTAAVLQQVEDTLTAAMLDSGAAAAVRSGLLVTGLRAAGLDPVDAAAAVAVPEALGFTAQPREAPAPEPPSLHVVRRPEADREEAEQALAEAEEALARRAVELEEAAADVSRVEARELQLSAEIDEAKRRLAELEEQLDRVEEELAEAEEARDEADQAAADATRSRDDARKRLDALE